MTRGFDDAEYRGLLTQFPARPIEGEDDLRQVGERMSELLSKDERALAEGLERRLADAAALLSQVRDELDDIEATQDRAAQRVLVKKLVKDVSASS